MEKQTMWRAFLLAIGISLLLVGAECLVLDRVILAQPGTSRSSSDLSQLDFAMTSPRKVLVPPEAAPWVLLASGAIAVLYARSGGGGGGEG
jgi:hypothetical protein